MYSQSFLRALSFVLNPKVEGGFSNDPDDKGNWTGGEVGKGELLGTKYGISAASYPQLDIKNLNVEQVTGIYWKDYWMAIKGDELPGRVAVVVLDAAVNQGVGAAVKLLQAALDVLTDGVIGPQTITAARSKDQDEILTELFAQRAIRYTKATKFPKYGHGWFRRLFREAMEVAR